MTEAMPFLQKTILLSYDPRPFVRCVFLRLTAGGADAETWAKNNGYTFIAQ